MPLSSVCPGQNHNRNALWYHKRHVDRASSATPLDSCTITNDCQKQLCECICFIQEEHGIKAINTSLEWKASIKLGLFLVGSTTINNVPQIKKAQTWAASTSWALDREVKRLRLHLSWNVRRMSEIRQNGGEDINANRVLLPHLHGEQGLQKHPERSIKSDWRIDRATIKLLYSVGATVRNLAPSRWLQRRISAAFWLVWVPGITKSDLFADSYEAWRE